MDSGKLKIGELTRLQRALCGGLFAVYGLAAGLWFLFMPHGFPAGCARFWTNSVLPAACGASMGAGLVALWRKRDGLPRAIVLGIFFFWLSLAAWGGLVFPVSVWRFGPLLCLAALLHARPAYLAWRDARSGLRRLAMAGLPAAVLALLVSVSQRAGPAETRPRNRPAPVVRVTAAARRRSRDALAVGQDVEVGPGHETVICRCGEVELEVRPLLTFRSRSPDRCWTVFAPPRARMMPARPAEALSREGGRVRLAYGGKMPALLQLRHDGDARITHLEAFTRLQEPVYSHLNSFCTIRIRGAGRPFLSFSPCPEERVEVLPCDYPVGRPARLAYLGADGVFNVVEASSGEKGPFRALASGRLGRGEPLAMTLYDGERACARVVLEDWAAQAATALSPTAGWGLPVNAIEFSRYGPSPAAEAYIFITLAGTSVGRGWDSVGHAAGVYRNRMRIEDIRQLRPRAAEPRPGPTD